MKQKLYKKCHPKTWYYNRDLNDYFHFCNTMKAVADHLKSTGRTPIFLCIGSDRITGDCLGPLVGHKLKERYPNRIFLYGTLEYPVHALNLSSFLSLIQKKHKNAFLVAIDASLGSSRDIGSITVSEGSLSPGEGVKKTLPPVGNLSITGIVNSCQGDTEALLQNTRLHLVNELSDFIFMGIANGFDDYFTSGLSD